ncbi:MAG: glycosyltransferase family A protein [Gemmatimonadota bacterium]
MRPTLAVLVTYHNEGALLSECLATLAAQGPVDEIMVFDDASDIRPEAYLPTGLPVHVVRSDRNVGPSVGRNRLLAASRAEFIHFHDADDLFLAGWTEHVLAAVAEGVDCVFTEVETIHEDDTTHADVMGLGRLEQAGDLLTFALMQSMLTIGGTYRRALVQKVGGYNERLWQSEDYEFHARLALARPSWCVIERSLVRSRVRTESRSQKRYEVWSSAWQAVLELGRLVPASHQPDLAAFSERVGRQLWQLGARHEALAAFQFAETHGVRPGDLQPGHRWLARRVGLVRAHQIASLYRALLPRGLRRLLAGLRN